MKEDPREENQQEVSEEIRAIVPVNDSSAIESSEKPLDLQQLVEDMLRKSLALPGGHNKEDVVSSDYPLTIDGVTVDQKVKVFATKQPEDKLNRATIRLIFEQEASHAALVINMLEDDYGIPGLVTHSFFEVRNGRRVDSANSMNFPVETFLEQEAEPKALQALANVFGQPVTNVKTADWHNLQTRGSFLKGIGYSMAEDRFFTKVFQPQK